MKLYNHTIPALHYNPSTSIKSAQVVPEQMLNEKVHVYKEALPYIKCEIQSTIQHEAGHRKDEEGRYKSIGQNQQVPTFEEFTSTNRAEGIAEREEENCSSLKPFQISGSTEEVSLQQLFAEAKGNANIESGYKGDVRAGTLSPDAQGMYLMQELPEETRANLKVVTTTHPNLYQGFDGTLWVDVRKIVAPFIAQETNIKSQPATFQDDGIVPDVPTVSQQPPTPSAIPAAPSIQSVPSVGAWT